MPNPTVLLFRKYMDKKIIKNLLKFDKSINEHTTEIRKFITSNTSEASWQLNVNNVEIVGILKKYIKGEISKEHLYQWANLVVDIYPYLKITKEANDIILALETPEIEIELTKSVAMGYIKTLSQET